MDGSNVEDVVTGLDHVPNSLALDVAGGKMYWTDGPGRIQRASLDGSNVEDVVTGLEWPWPNSLALDVARGQIYWIVEGSGRRAGRIQRASLDGSNVEDVVTGLEDPNSLALDLSGVKNGGNTGTGNMPGR